MRVLFITHYASLLGANRSLLHLIRRLREDYHIEPLVFCPAYGAFTQALQEQGVRFEVRPYTNWAYTLRSLKFWLYPLLHIRSQNSVLPELINLARVFNPHIVHSNSLVVSLGWKISEALGVKHVWHIREYGWEDYGLIFFRGVKFVQKKLTRADAVIFISNALKAARPYYETLNAHVVYNGVGSEAELHRLSATPMPPPDAPFTFLIIGLLHPSKGQLEALRAFVSIVRKGPSMRLIIVGKGRKLYTLHLTLLKWIKGMGDKVQFTGYLSKPEEAYKQANVVLMCSPSEAMGRVTAEAMAYGRPVIGYNGGATPELIEPNKSGLLYNHLKELSEQMLFLSRNTDLCRSMGHYASDQAVKYFSDEQYAAGCLRVYEQLLES
ncbi:MAG: glycosyltransferase family 4 protein [Saprospiraceae bacterium]|nr:glycosyltransferase family 4 protein [Saprospiraceae bacterium]